MSEQKNEKPKVGNARTLVKRKDIDQTAGRMRSVWYVISANRDALQTE